jgi:hypothetical protein
LELLNREIDAFPIISFCKAVLSRHSTNWPPKEETLAEEFVQWLGLKTFMTRDELIELCVSKRVNLSFAELPTELRGLNCSFENKTEIIIAQREAVPGADLHILFHEFRELLENAFAEIGYATLGADDLLEVQAEVFAMSARMWVVTREIPAFVEIVSNADAKWARYLGYGVIGVVGFIYLLSCVFLPQFEEIESEAKPQRYIRT